MTTNEPAQYWSVTEIGALFGGSGHTVDVWRRRYSPGRAAAEIQKAPAFPEPDIVLGVSRPLAGWSPEREPEIRAWYASRRGVPGRTRAQPRRTPM